MPLTESPAGAAPKRRRMGRTPARASHPWALSLVLLCACAPETDERAMSTSAPGSRPPTDSSRPSDETVHMRRALMSASLFIPRIHVVEAGDPGPPPGGIPRLRRRVQADSSDHLSRFELAEALVRDGDYAHAEKQYRAAIRLQPTHAASYAGLARMLMLLPRNEDAAAILAAAARSAQATARLHTLTGKLALRQGHYAEAAAAFRDAVDVDPSGAVHYYLLADALERRGSIPSGISALRRGLAHVPGSPGLHLRLVELLTLNGDYEEALAQSSELIAVHPSATAYVARSRIYRHIGDLAAARAAVEGGLETAPTNVDLTAELGVILFELGQQEGATVHLEDAVLRDPDLLEASSALVRAYEARGDPRATIVRKYAEHLRHHEQELKSLKTAIALDNSDAAAFFSIGGLYAHLARPVAAAQALEVGLRIVPDQVEPLGKLGTVLLTTQQLPRAMDTLERLLLLDSTSVSGHTHLAGAFAASGDPLKAVTGFRRALALDPEYAPAHLGLAQAYKALGKTAEARSSLAAFERLRGEFAERGDVASDH